jgi:hypothetical protein
MSTTAPYFFISYSREDTNLQRRISAELRGARYQGLGGYREFDPRLSRLGTGDRTLDPWSGAKSALPSRMTSGFFQF